MSRAIRGIKKVSSFMTDLLSSYLKYSLLFTVTSPKILYVNRKDIRIIRPNQKRQNETIVVIGLLDAIAVNFRLPRWIHILERCQCL